MMGGSVENMDEMLNIAYRSMPSRMYRPCSA